jgi:hypothetical protein
MRDGRRNGGAPALSDQERARIEALLDRLDPKVGEPGSVPGEVVLFPGGERRPIAA